MDEATKTRAVERLTEINGEAEYETLIQFVDCLLSDGASKDKLRSELGEFLGGDQSEEFADWICENCNVGTSNEEAPPERKSGRSGGERERERETRGREHKTLKDRENTKNRLFKLAIESGVRGSDRRERETRRSSRVEEDRVHSRDVQKDRDRERDRRGMREDRERERERERAHAHRIRDDRERERERERRGSRRDRSRSRSRGRERTHDWHQRSRGERGVGDGEGSEDLDLPDYDAREKRRERDDRERGERERNGRVQLTAAGSKPAWHHGDERGGSGRSGVRLLPKQSRGGDREGARPPNPVILRPSAAAQQQHAEGGSRVSLRPAPSPQAAEPERGSGDADMGGEQPPSGGGMDEDTEVMTFAPTLQLKKNPDLKEDDIKEVEEPALVFRPKPASEAAPSPQPFQDPSGGALANGSNAGMVGGAPQYPNPPVGVPAFGAPHAPPAEPGNGFPPPRHVPHMAPQQRPQFPPPTIVRPGGGGGPPFGGGPPPPFPPGPQAGGPGGPAQGPRRDSQGGGRPPVLRPSPLGALAAEMGIPPELGPPHPGMFPPFPPPAMAAMMAAGGMGGGPPAEKPRRCPDFPKCEKGQKCPFIHPKEMVRLPVLSVLQGGGEKGFCVAAP